MSRRADTTAAPAALLRASPPFWLHGLVVFAAAWLVFWVQPLAVRGVLLVLGGSPAVCKRCGSPTFPIHME